LHRIAINRALNLRRRAAERVSRDSLSLTDDPAAAGPGTMAAEHLADTAPGGSPLRHLEARELRRRLAACLDKLPPLWRSVLALRDGEELSYQEIAAVLETALGTVRSRLARARLALRQCVQGEEAA
jgi:RNA polymerase sigma-70 factor (ECF subfamily)